VSGENQEDIGASGDGLRRKSLADEAGGGGKPGDLDQAGPLVLPETLRIGMQTGAGLAAAHAQGLGHRDVKPVNILLEEGIELVRLTDSCGKASAPGISETQDHEGTRQPDGTNDALMDLRLFPRVGHVPGDATRASRAADTRNPEASS